MKLKFQQTIIMIKVFRLFFTAWVTGKEALEMESLSEDQVIQDMMAVLRAFLGRDDVPKPRKIIR